MEFTLGSMYWINPNYTPDDFREDMRRIRENRISLLRICVLWEYVETERGRFDFTHYDAFFRAAEEAGIGVMPTFLFYPPLWLMLELEEMGESDPHRRYPCLDRPEIRAGVDRLFSATVARYKDSPSLRIWNLWNEPTDGMCECPHSLDRFAEWLKKKYPTIDTLKASWASEYGIFHPLLPRSREDLNGTWLKKIRSLPNLRGRDTAMRIDWAEFQTENAMDHVRFLKGLVRRYDPLHETHSNPCTNASNPMGNGFSPWALGKVQESTGVSIHPHHAFDNQEDRPEDFPVAIVSVLDLVRSWAGGKDAWLCEYQAGSTYMKPHAYTPTKHDISSTLFHALARGLRGVIFWEWQSWRHGVFETAEFSLRNPSDGGPTERSEAAKEFGVFLEKYGPVLAELKEPAPQAAVLCSWDQSVLDSLMAQFTIRDFYNLHSFAVHACHKALDKAGIPCDFVTESQIAEGVLTRYKVLFLPMVRTISKNTAEKIADFVRAGGAVWADGRCGFLDHGLYLRGTVPGNGLDQVFGCREIDETAPREDSLLIRKDGSTLKPYREIQRLKPYESAEVLAECGGYPAAVRNSFGAGVAELWGTYLTPNRAVDLSRLIPVFARKHGASAPVLLKQGEKLLISSRRSSGAQLIVVTSLADREQTVEAELTIPAEKLLNKGAAELIGKKALRFTIRKGETRAILLEGKNEQYGSDSRSTV